MLIVEILGGILGYYAASRGMRYLRDQRLLATRRRHPEWFVDEDSPS